MLQGLAGQRYRLQFLQCKMYWVNIATHWCLPDRVALAQERGWL